GPAADRSSGQTASSATPVVIGIDATAIIAGRVNHLTRTVSLIHGVAIEIRIRPRTMGGQAILLHSIAFSWSWPSVFITSHVAPSSAYAIGSAAAIAPAKIG